MRRRSSRSVYRGASQDRKRRPVRGTTDRVRLHVRRSSALTEAAGVKAALLRGAAAGGPAGGPTARPAQVVLSAFAFPRGYSVLVAGPSGSGKTLLANPVPPEGAESGLLAVFEKRRNDYLDTTPQGGSFVDLVKRGKLEVVYLRPL